VLEFCKSIDDHKHWAAKAFTLPQGKKIVDAAMENAKKRESNSKLLQSIEDGFRGPLVYFGT